MEELRLHALEPDATLGGQRVAQAHERPQLLQVLGRDPRLGDRLARKQLTQMTGIGSIGLRPSLRPPQSASLGRLGELRPRPRPLELFDDEAPARGRLERHLQARGINTSEPATQTLSGRRLDPANAHLARAQINQVKRDLRRDGRQTRIRSTSGPPRAPG
jgi:hypothetical protein